MTSFTAIPTSDLENADEVQLKTMAHSLLESKLEKMMSTAGNPDQMTKTKKLAVEWMRKWDLDGDGILSSVEMKGAAMEHARLEREYKTRGMWILILALLIFCCGGVILGVSIWANAISKDSEVETGEDLGGYTMRKKDGSAVVKTATALYEFPLPRIGYLPFDELSTIESITFLYKKSLRQMTVSEFKWYGTHSIAFISPRGEQLSVVKDNDISLTMTIKEAGPAAVPFVLYDGVEPNYAYRLVLFALLDDMQRAGHTPTLIDALNVTSQLSLFEIDNQLPPECAEPARELMANMTKPVAEPCATMLMLAFQGYGIVEAKVGPEDYYGTKMSAAERADLGRYSTVGTAVFVPGQTRMFDDYTKWLEQEVKARYHT
eukprot:jgi/Mesvir1/2089/Mv16621-RA.1